MSPRLEVLSLERAAGARSRVENPGVRREVLLQDTDVRLELCQREGLKTRHLLRCAVSVGRKKNMLIDDEVLVGHSRLAEHQAGNERRRACGVQHASPLRACLVSR